ncbi:hydroxymethylbilane synthase [Sphingorhabdus arenilitoris]|uniref:Hydroxymethylbilane synthase n=1 Tax=Sphingorhabdus arenilitoris TaxID=1490041 RepID=A0ABV8RIZ4_9SPHN
MTAYPLFTAQKPLRIGTRRSPLAMAQAQMAASALRSRHALAEAAVILVPILASGDKIQDRPLAQLGGKALWTKELERALSGGDIDVAVHSMKDVETVRPADYRIGAMLPRADVRDRMVGAPSIAALPMGAHVGTSSPRRAAQLLAQRRDLKISSIRGNVATRLSKVESGEFDATLLAAAGLDRLSRPDTGHAIEVDQMLPAASQGAVGIEALAARQDLQTMLSAVNHAPTFACVMAERAFLEALGGNCHSPVAALAVQQGAEIWLRGEILSDDGNEKYAGDIRFVQGDVGGPHKLAEQLLRAASDRVKALFGA